jgi:Na+-driven multidrug efflux pump
MFWQLMGEDMVFKLLIPVLITAWAITVSSVVSNVWVGLALLPVTTVSIYFTFSASGISFMSIDKK